MSDLDFDTLFESATQDAVDASTRYKSTSYFHKDCTWIAEQAQSSPDTFPGIAALVLLSIRQPFWHVPKQIADVAKRGSQSVYLFGWKREGLQFVRDNKRDLWRSAQACYSGAKSLDELILDYLAIPGLGIVKASFMAQLTVGQGACMDTLNLRTLGLSETAFRLSKKLTIGTVRKRIATYNATWSAQGDTAYWWNTWCDFVAERTGNVLGRRMGTLGDAATVSATHRLAINGGIQ